MSIKELEEQIKYHQNLYYNNQPEITDAEFDALVDKLATLDPTNPLLTTMVGSDHTEGFKKEKHRILMGSQSKANTEEEMQTWLSSIDNSVVLATYKCDGISLELNYDNGVLVSCLTRGDGIYGDNCTKNAIKMKGVPTKIDSKFTGAVRGEVLLFRKDKEKYYSDMKNCRNAASGIVKRLDGVGCEHLTVVCYDVQYSDNRKFNNQMEIIKFLEDNKFNVVEYKVMKNLKATECMEYLNNVFGNFDNLDYDIDGIVFKQNTIDMNDIKNNVRPKTQIALKPEMVLKETTIRDIKWQVKNGRLTPVAIFDGVDIQGATVKQASAYNVSFLEELDIEIGDKVLVTRFNMIIPGIVSNITKNKHIA